jgi:hypothetical protein
MQRLNIFSSVSYWKLLHATRIMYIKLAFYYHLLNITGSQFPELQNKILTWLVYSLRLIIFKWPDAAFIS